MRASLLIAPHNEGDSLWKTSRESLPTSVRHFVLSITTLTSVLMFLDRNAVNIAAKYILEDLQMTQTQMAWFISLFFWTYAFGQVFGAWFSDRCGFRLMLTIYILASAAFTGLLGVTHVIWFMLLLRPLCGLAQAGIRPSSVGLLRQWYPVSARGRVSAIVGFGTAFGVMLAPILTAFLIAGYGWRAALITYGVVGIPVAALFVLITRNSPDQHTWCNDAERSLIRAEGLPVLATVQNPPFPWRSVLTSRSLWGNSMTQFCCNIGGFYAATAFPRYLDEIHHVPLLTRGLMMGISSGVGIVGLIAGGRCIDLAARRLGLKWSRRVPLVLSRFVAALVFVFCLLLSFFGEPGTVTAWLHTGGMCVLSIALGFGSPASWAYAQDVGGKYTASIYGWANMCGGIGGSMAPLIYNAVLGESPTIENWNSIFALCCGVTVLAGLCALLVDATKLVTVEPERQQFWPSKNLKEVTAKQQGSLC